MRRSLRAGAAALAAIAALLGGCATGNSTGPGGITSVSAPAPATVGDAWEYRVTSGYSREARGILRQRVVEHDGRRLVVETTGLQEDRRILTPDLQWIVHPLADDRVQTFDPAYPALVFPLAVGQRWDLKVRGRDVTPPHASRRRGDTGDVVTVQGAVLGWERLRVPAGEYDTLRVRRVTYGGNFSDEHGQSEISETLWYAPAIGRVVRHESVWKRRVQYTILMDVPPYLNGDWLVYELLPPGEPRAALAR